MSINTILVTIEHDIEKPFEFCQKATKVIQTYVDDHAELKQTLTDLISKSETLGAQISVDVADKGSNCCWTLKPQTASSITLTGFERRWSR